MAVCVIFWETAQKLRWTMPERYKNGRWQNSFPSPPKMMEFPPVCYFLDWLLRNRRNSKWLTAKHLYKLPIQVYSSSLLGVLTQSNRIRRSYTVVATEYWDLVGCWGWWGHWPLGLFQQLVRLLGTLTQSNHSKDL